MTRHLVAKYADQHLARPIPTACDAPQCLAQPEYVIEAQVDYEGGWVQSFTCGEHRPKSAPIEDAHEPGSGGDRE